MARAALQPDDIAAFRDRATAAATRLFAAHGFDAVTMRAVADALGVSAMTPYRYLGGKDELVGLVRADAFRRFADHLEAAVGRRDDGAAAALLRLKRAYVRFAVDAPDAYRIMFELREPADQTPSPELARESRRAFGCLHDCVGAAIAAGELVGEPLTVAQLLWASVHGLVSLHLAGRLSRRALDALTAVDHELAGFRIPPPRRRSSR